MKKNNLTRIAHARDAARTAAEIIGSRKFDDIYKDKVLALALTRLIEIIGEAANLVSPDFKTKYPEIPWRVMVDTRNRLIHGYNDIDLKIVWDTVIYGLPNLESELTNILEKEGFSE